MSAIPPIKYVPQELAKILVPIKENIERVTGQLPGIDRVQKLQSTAALTDVINKLNELIDRMQLKR